MIDTIKYAFSFDFITNAYIPFITETFIILLISFIALIIFALFYKCLENTILEHAIAVLIGIAVVSEVFLFAIFALTLVALPLLLIVIALKVYLSGLFPDTPFLVLGILSFIIAIIIVSVIELLKVKSKI